MTKQTEDPWKDEGGKSGPGRRAVEQHLAAVEVAAARFTDDLARKVIVGSVSSLRKSAAEDKVLDRYHDTGLDPVKACKGPLITRSSAKATEEDYNRVVARLIQAGWIVRSSGVARRGRVLYSFHIGETWSGPTKGPALPGERR